jgi:hypothetical protein
MNRYAKNSTATLLAICSAMLAFACYADDATPATQPVDRTQKPHIDTITVEAERDRKAIERQVNGFVSGIAVAPRDQSLANWQTTLPLCPLVAGLPRDDGEYMLARISKIAAAAGAPLAAEHCRPNFYVIVTSEVNALLKAWGRRDPTMFGDAGGTLIHKFLHSSTPVRAWYNAAIYNADGTPLGSGDSQGSGFDFSQTRVNLHAEATRIRFNDVRNLGSVIVIIDAPRARGVTFGQLAAYVAMIGLAEIRIDARANDAPSSILQLFATSGKVPPPALSAWDEAFLKALYHVEHLDQHQLSSVKTTMVGEIAPH